ncbi:glycosyltransferase family 9 protein [Cerasicoccus maritimus]|uniref:glycosyltransferase family 9 protein n=1 Tax=Cerasicoccus maritimus TaxID=490089 RepID=UPI002852A029|nr:glycosyltransferase family 9 protein [Cerasicoccus maritimus]
MRIVLFRTDRLGDVIISSALVEATRRAYPEATVCFCAKQAFGPLLFAPDDAAQFIPWDGLTAPQLAAYRFDISIHLHPDPACAALAAQAGIPTRAGFTSDEQWLTQTLPYRKDAGQKHELDYCLEVVQSALPKIKDPWTPQLPFTAWNAHHAQPRVVVHCGSFGAKAKLPPTLLATLAEAALPPVGEPIVQLIGTKEEFALAEQTANELKARHRPVENLAGKLPLPGLVELISTATVFIGRDSGPAHLAAATGCPTFCIIPSTRPDTSPTRWRPLGPRVHLFKVDAKPWPWQKNTTAAEKAFRRLDPQALSKELFEFLEATFAS